jgi:hypothetical protein
MDSVPMQKWDADPGDKKVKTPLQILDESPEML